MSTRRYARRFALALAGVLSLGLGLSALGQTTYYVSQSAGNDDSNGTTAETPWKTLAKASAVTWRPGDKLLLKCGDTWNEGLTLRGDGSASNLVTVASYGAGERPLISRTKGNRNACILIDKASGYRIRDLELSFAQNGIRIEADSRVRAEQGDYLIENCFFHDTAGNPDFQGGNHLQYVHMGWAIYTEGSASPQPVKIKNLTVRNCVGLRTQGFYMPQGPMAQENVLFDGCTIAHNSFNSVYQNGARDFDIVNCVFVYGYPWEFHPNGTTMVIAGGIDGDATVRNAVTNNEFGWAGEYPGRPDGCGYDFEGATAGVTFQNNFIHNSFGESVLFMGGFPHKDLICDGNIFRNNVRFSPRWHDEVTVGGNGGNGIFSNNRFFARPGINSFAGKPACFTFTNNDEQAKGEFVEMPLVTRIVRGSGERTYTLASRTAGASIRYTLDGSIPTVASTLYAGPVTVRRSGVLNAKAFKDGCLPSYVNSLGVELRNREGEGLVACWKLDETSGTAVADSVGGHHGTLSGGKWTGGKMGGGLQFIRTEDKVALDSAALIAITNDFTLTFWANPKVPRPWTLESEDGEAGKSGQRYAIAPKDPGPVGGVGLGVSVGINGVSVCGRTAPLLVVDAPLSGWNHITVVYRTRQPTLYLNGVFEKAGLKSGQVRPTFDLGGSEFGRYVGGLDDVRVYDRALTDGEIQENYNLHFVEGPRLAAAPSTNAAAVKSTAAEGVWKGYRMRLNFSGYRQAETLKDFPVLVVLGAQRSGFAYNQFLSTHGWDLRFTASDGTTELPYEIEKWDPAGASYVWVQVPELHSNAWITASWGDPGRKERESYTSDGLVWLSGFVTVAHLGEADGPARDSTDSHNDGFATNGVTRNVAGVVGGGCAFDGVGGRVQFDTVAQPQNSFTYSAWVRTAATHENDPETFSASGGTSGQKFAFSPDHGGGNAGSGLSVGSNGIGVYEHGHIYMPALTVATNAIGTGWNYVSVVYANKQPAIYVNGCVCAEERHIAADGARSLRHRRHGLWLFRRLDGRGARVGCCALRRLDLGGVPEHGVERSVCGVRQGGAGGEGAEVNSVLISGLYLSGRDYDRRLRLETKTRDEERTKPMTRQRKPAMSTQNAIPEHLSEKMTISFWLWNYFYGIKKGEYFHDLEQCFVELKERGFNTVRVDSGAGLCHTADGEPRGQIRLHEPFPGYSSLRQMDMRTDMATKGGCQCNVLDKVVELFELARKYDVRVILSSWFYLHTFWFVEDDLVEEFFALPPEKRFMRFAVETDRILAVLKARGLQGQIAFVEIFNEFDSLTSYWKLDKLWKTDSEKLQGMHDFRRWHEEALDMLKARHPDLLFAIDTCHSGVNREILPRNAHVWNHHMYYSWGAYWKVFETPVYESGFDFANAGKHPALGRFLRSPLIPIEAVRSCRKYLQYVEHSWPIRVWLYNNLDDRQLPALELLLDEHLTSQIAEYKKAIDDSIRMALETRQALFPDILLVVGEGATYCGHPKMRWEEKAEAYWELVDYATRRLKDEGYWGCVARTNSGPEDPSWIEFPERLRHATASFLGNQGQ